MQKYFRARIGSLERLAPRRTLYIEALNPHFGFFYTVKKALLKKKTGFQDLQVLDTDEFGRVLLLDNITQVADRNDWHYHEPMVHPALCCHPHPASVLVIGGGDGGIIREALKYPSVRSIDLAELDGRVIDVSKKYLPRVHGGAFDDPRVRIHVTDGRRFVEKHPGTYDVIIMDLTDPSGPAARLYTREFFTCVKRSFKNSNGVFVMHSESPLSRPTAFASIQKTLRAAFPEVFPFYLYIHMYGVLWSITLSALQARTFRCSPATIDARLARQGINGLKVYCGATHHSMQTPYPFISDLLSKPSRIITDAKPDFPDNFLCFKPSRKRVRR
jgi:spermidine synthase